MAVERSAQGSSSSRLIWPALLVAFVAALVFVPALHNGFLDWDDNVFLVSNTRYRGLGLVELRWMFTTFYQRGYFPLCWLTYAIDYRIWGLDPFGFHLTNVLLHVFNAVLVYFLAWTLMEKARGGRGAALAAGASASALLFALHPLRVESVAWVAERRDVLSGALVLGAVLLYLQSQASAAGDARRKMRGSIVLFALSLLAKAVAITLPFVLLVLDAYPLRRLGSPEGRRAALREKAPFAVAAAAIAAVELMSGQVSTASPATVGLPQRMAQAFYGLFFYLWKTALPIGLSPLVEAPFPFHPLASRFVGAALFVGCATAALWAARRRWPAGLACWTAYVLAALPMLGLVQYGTRVLVADRYSYLVCVPWAVLAGAAFRSFWESGSAARMGASAVAAACALGLAWRTIAQIRVWRDSETFWTYAVRSAPDSPLALTNLGRVRFGQGRIDDATVLFRRAAGLERGFAPAHYDLGMALIERHAKVPEVEREFRAAIADDPTFAIAHATLGNLLMATGRRAEAVRELRDALRLDPENPEIRRAADRLFAAEPRAP